MKINNKNKRLQYAMIGGAEGSFIGPIHRMAIRLDDLADLVAGCFSRNAVNNRKTAEVARIDSKRVYAKWQDLIAAEKERIDFVVICTTNESHFAIAKAALMAGLDVFCEKPLSLTVSEAKTLAKLATTKHRVLAIPFTYTGYPMIKLARDLVKRGELGKIDKIHLEYVQGSFRREDRKGRPWKMDPKIAGSSCVVADIGVHAFTMVEYVSGLKVTSLLADLSTYANDNGLDDDASILLRFGEHVKGVIVTSKVATGEENGVRLRIYGSKASLHWDQENPNYLKLCYPEKPQVIISRKSPCVSALSAASIRASRFPAGHHEGFVEALANIYDEFCAAVRDRKEHDFPSTELGVRSMLLTEASLKSSKAGVKWIKIS